MLVRMLVLFVAVAVYFVPLLVIGIMAIFWMSFTGEDLTNSKWCVAFIRPLIFLEEKYLK